MEEFDFDAVFDVDDYLYFYGETLTDERANAEVSALVSLLNAHQPMRILDLACGFGRHTNRLAALGYSMTGVDLSAGFLQIARQQAARMDVQVDYQQADMREIAFEDEFDWVMLLFTAFGYFPDAENLQVLVNVSRALKKGGQLVFDTLNRDAIAKDFHPAFVIEKEGNLMIDRLSFDSLEGRFYDKRIVIRDGVRKDKPYFVRLYNSNEIKDLLSSAGMLLENVYGSFDRKEFKMDSHRMVVVARKP
jgi:SAM-dependent methyltransferase